MSRQEFEEWFGKETLPLGISLVAIGRETNVADALGCWFDEETGKWKVYENDGRGERIIYFETTDEGMAFEQFKAIIEFEQKNTEGYL